MFKDNFANLEEYLKTFSYSYAIIQKPKYLKQIAYELAQNNQNEDVRYIKVRFAPQLHINKNINMKTVITSIDKKLALAQQKFNQRPEITANEEPPFNYNIIVNTLQTFSPYSEYYTKFLATHPFSDPNTIVSLCSLELTRKAVQIRNNLGIPIVKFDLTNTKKENPPKHHRQTFQHTHENFIAKTVHANEAYGPPSIFQAITELHTERIGHRLYPFDTSKVNPAKIKSPGLRDRQRYVDELSQFIADRRMTIEMCLTSNLQTNPDLDIKNHSFKKMLEQELSTSICTDNRTISKTTVTNEIKLMLQNFDMNPKTLKNIIIYNFKRSFFPDRYANKQQYVRQCINYYEKLMKKTVLEA